ncbi:MAG: DUF1016 N-terminal domain-containing protein [Prevotellaceae bacterium]|nr:DUF1016 N-terminal domain-containing protein [Prevotellaceae bacterium]
MSENQLSTILAQSMRELEFPQAFGLVPWGHHIDIIEHCQSIDEALFYIKKTIEGGWSRNTLMNCIKGHYYENLGGAITNFADKLPFPQSELAQAITKDTYDFGFISLEEGSSSIFRSTAMSLSSLRQSRSSLSLQAN